MKVEIYSRRREEKYEWKCERKKEGNKKWNEKMNKKDRNERIENKYKIRKD